MGVIYEPRGKAREYSELALNLYKGCSHACKYCYCPAITRQSLEDWSKDPQPKVDILKKVEREARKMQGCSKELLLCFMSDPYQDEKSANITRQTLLIFEKYGFSKIQVLTKGGELAINDFDIISRNKGWKFGSTIIFENEALREEWEPGASTIQSRYNAVKKAHEMGIYTWVSIEPVVNSEEALKVIKNLKPYVSFWKVGKINHYPEIEKKIDWSKFLKNALIELNGQAFMIKKDLLAFYDPKTMNPIYEKPKAIKTIIVSDIPIWIREQRDPQGKAECDEFRARAKARNGKKTIVNKKLY